jgi:hypothetical protein
MSGGGGGGGGGKGVGCCLHLFGSLRELSTVGEQACIVHPKMTPHNDDNSHLESFLI